MADPHLKLRDDVRLLGELLGEVLRDCEGPWLLDTVERVRALSKDAHAEPAGRTTAVQLDPEELDAMATLLRAIPADAAVPVARAFSHFLGLANIAEQHHRVRRRRDHQRDPAATPQPGSCDEAFGRFLHRGVDPARLHEAVLALRIELVLTAHPTEISRRALAYKRQAIARALDRNDRADLTPAEREELRDILRREIASTWATADVRPRRPTPIDEVIGGLLVFEQTLWDAVPAFLRVLDRALLRATGRGLPLDAAPITFGSWIGGDRDGNPNVTHDVTRVACLVSRWIAADLYLRDIEALRLELSMARGSSELHAASGVEREPYRVLLGRLRDRLAETRAAIGRELEVSRAAPDRVEGLAGAGAAHDARGRRPTDAELDGSLLSASDLLEPLQLCHRSLVETGFGLIAGGRLCDLLRRVAVFGTTLVKLDIRQHAGQHAAVIQALGRARDLGSYADGSEADKQQILHQLAGTSLHLEDADDEVQEVVETFRTAARIHPESLGAYVISMVQAPSDVLAVDLLQRACGLRLRIVPLFEQIDTLRCGADTMKTLLALPDYGARIDGRHEVMIGYSDSAKDGSRLAANWEIYKAQESIARVCTEAGVELTLFHGRGGSIGRGGGPTHLAIQSQPPGTVPGRMRDTVQGEMIQAQFGVADVALRTLEVYTTSVLDMTLLPGPRAHQAWRDAMDGLAAASMREYRHIVYDDPPFLRYFRTATPEAELGAVPIGSRPARRITPGQDPGVESLRAIPWVFAWTQTRLLLPSWLGTGDALDGALADGGLRERLREMHANWPFFHSTITLIETAVAMADARIAAEYDRQLVPPELRTIGEDLRRRLGVAARAILSVTGETRLLERNPVLRRSIDVRNPYVDPINIVQIELLRRLRAEGEAASAQLWDAFTVTVNGIAAGMRNTG